MFSLGMAEGIVMRNHIKVLKLLKENAQGPTVLLPWENIDHENINRSDYNNITD